MRVASVYTDLVFHLLAFVPVGRDAPPLARAASSFSEPYKRWARASLPAEAVDPCERDAELLGAMLARPEVATGIQLLAILHEDTTQAIQAALKSVRELTARDVASPWALSALQRLPPEPVEIARIALALAAPEFAEAHATTIAPLAQGALAEIHPLLEACKPSLGALASARLQLSAPLGEHGRGYGDGIIVGLHTLPPEPTRPAGPLVFAVHEIAVQAASKALEERGLQGTWALSERAALQAGEQAVAGSVLEAPYLAWRAGLDTSGLAREGEVPPEVVSEVVARLSRSSA